MNSDSKNDWINIACWVWIAFFVVWKIYLLAAGQPLVYWLDFTNPSLFGLLFTACVITLIVRRMRAGRAGTSNSPIDPGNQSDS